MTYKLSMETLLQKQALLSDLKIGKRNNYIHGLQTILFEMGFAKELNWERFGADGDFGKSTARALKAFAKKNGITAKGNALSLKLAKIILKRYNILDDLQHLAEAIQENKVEKMYSLKANEKTGNTILKSLLADLGYKISKESSTTDEYSPDLIAALVAFGKKENMPTDGKKLTEAVAQRIIDKLSVFYGDALLILKAKKVINTSLLVQTIIENSKTKINVFDGTHQKQFTQLKKGLYTFGNQKLLKFLKTQKAQLTKNGITDSAINVMRAVAENEGNLDAINTWDNSFLSFGIFQWTLGAGNRKGELPALLKKLKANDPDTFFKYFGQHGLDVSRFTNSEQGFISFQGKDIKTAAGKQQFRSPQWAFRFWLAGQDMQVMAIEVQHALDRLHNFYWKQNVAGKAPADFISSEYGVALLLDNHVNRPGYVAKCMLEGYKNSGLQFSDQWDTDEEQLLIEAYLKVRKDFGKFPMTDAVKRANVTKKYVKKGLLSEERGSFVYVAQTSGLK